MTKRNAPAAKPAPARRTSSGFGLGLSLGFGLGKGVKGAHDGDGGKDDGEEGMTPEPPPKSELRRLGVGGGQEAHGVEGLDLGCAENNGGGREGMTRTVGKGVEDGRRGSRETDRTATGFAPRTGNQSGRAAAATAVPGTGNTHTICDRGSAMRSTSRRSRGLGISSSSSGNNAQTLDLARDLDVPVDLLKLIEHDILELLDAQPDINAAAEQYGGGREGDVRKSRSSLDLVEAVDSVEALESCEASLVDADEEEQKEDDEENDRENVDERAGESTWGPGTDESSRLRWQGLAYAAAAAAAAGVVVSQQRASSDGRQHSRSRSASSPPTPLSLSTGAASTAESGASSSTAVSLTGSIPSLAFDKAPLRLFAAGSPTGSSSPSSPDPLPPAPSPTPNTTPQSASPLSSPSPPTTAASSPRFFPLLAAPPPSLRDTTRVRRVASQRSLRKTALLQAVLAEMAGPLAEEAGEERMARARLLRRAGRRAVSADANPDGRDGGARGSWEGLGSVGGWVYL